MPVTMNGVLPLLEMVIIAVAVVPVATVPKLRLPLSPMTRVAAGAFNVPCSSCPQP